MAIDTIYLVGFGVFGLSTALQLLKENQADKLNLIILSYPQPQGASDDVSKISRVDYASIKRTEEAILAQRCLQSNERLSPSFQPVGRVVIYDKEVIKTLDAIDRVRNELGLPPRMRSDESLIHQNWGPCEPPKDSTYVFNEDDGLIDWDCVRVLSNEVEEELQARGGSRFINIRAETLKYDESRGRRIKSIFLSSGEELNTHDGRVVLCAGSWIPEILTHSDIAPPRHSRVTTATALFAFIVQLNEEQAAFFKGKPALSHIGKAEFLPPTKEDGIAKITVIRPFTNRVRDSETSYVEDLSQTSLAIENMLVAIEWARKLLPKLKGAKIVKIKTCWDGITATQDPMIARHQDHENLFLNGGGGFNRAKDLGTLGETVAKMLRGEEIDPRYGWDGITEVGNGDQPLLVAKEDFSQLDILASQNAGVIKWRQERERNWSGDFIEEI